MNAPADALPHYAKLAEGPLTRDLLHGYADALESRGEREALARLWARASQESRDEPGFACEAALRASHLFAQLGQRDAEGEVLAEVSARADIDPRAPRLLEALRRVDLVPELCRLLERSLDQHPEAEDGRFEELLYHLDERLDRASHAVAWCKKLAAHHAQSDVPFRSWVRLLEKHPGLGDPVAVLQSWANGRRGKNRAQVLLGLFEQLRQGGSLDTAAQALVEAAEAGPEMLEAFAESLDCVAAERGGEALARAGQRPLARAFFNRALTVSEDAAALWQRIDALWRGFAKMGELGRWKLGWSDRGECHDPPGLAIAGRLILMEAGELTAAHRGPLLDAFERASLTERGHALAVFQSAMRIEADTWVRRASEVLRNFPAEREGTLTAHIDYELRRGSPGIAVDLAQVMLVDGMDGSLQRLEAALDAAGKRGELLQRLLAAGARGAERPEVWLRLAGAYVAQEDWHEAQGALEQILPHARTLAWADLAWHTAEALGDARLCARAAEYHFQNGPALERARWGRTAARVLGWELGQSVRATELLHLAQAQSPWTVSERLMAARRQATSGEPLEARITLEMALQVLEDRPEATLLWLELAHLCRESGEMGPAREHLRRAQALVSDEPTDWAKLGSEARALGVLDVAVAGYQRAQSLQRRYADAYIETLLVADQPLVACETLERLAVSSHGDASATRWLEAATLAHRNRLGATRVQAALERVLHSPAQLPDLRAAAQLAVEAEEGTLAEGLCRRALPDDGDLVTRVVALLEQQGAAKKAADLAQAADLAAERIYELRVHAEDWAGCATLLMESTLDAALQKATALLRAYGATPPEAFLEWLNRGFPDSIPASDYRIKGAYHRREWDLLVQEIEHRIQQVGTSDALERAELHALAGEAMVHLGDRDGALEHWVQAVRGAPCALGAAWLWPAVQAATHLGDRAAGQALSANAVARPDFVDWIPQAPKEAASWLQELAAAGSPALRHAWLAWGVTQPIALAPALVAEVGRTMPPTSYRQALARLAEGNDPAFALLAGKAHRGHNDEAALGYLRAAAAADPDSGEARKLLGMLLTERGEFVEAARFLQGLSEDALEWAAIDEAEAYVAALLRAQDFARAVKVLEGMVSRFGGQAAHRRLYAQALEAAGRTEDALAAWLALGDAAALMEAARVALAQGDWGEAALALCRAHALEAGIGAGERLVELCTGAASVPGVSAGTFITVAQTLVSLGRERKALHLLELAAAQDPTAAMGPLVELHVQTEGSLSPALAEWVAATAEAQDFSSATWRRWSEAMGDHALAQGFADHAVAVGGDDPALWKWRRDRAHGDPRRFAALEAKLIDREGTDVARRSLALAELLQGELADAEGATAWLRRAACTDDADAGVLRRTADALAVTSGQQSLALATYGRLLLAEPTDRDLLRIAARLAGALGRVDSAIALYEVLRAVLPEDGEAKAYLDACRNPALPPRPLAWANDRVKDPLAGHPLDRLFELALPILGDVLSQIVAPKPARAEVLADATLGALAAVRASDGPWACQTLWSDGWIVAVGGDLWAEPRARAVALTYLRTLFDHHRMAAIALSEFELQGLVAALCPEGPVPATAETSRWQRRLDRKVRGAMRKEIQTVGATLKRAEDVTLWRIAAQAHALQVAWQRAGSLADTVSVYLATQGHSDLLDEQRQSLLRRSPALAALLRSRIKGAMRVLP
jgi:hypothetical protein